MPEPVIVPKEPIIGEVTVRYNHYKKPFKTIDNVLTWDSIDEQFSFSFVFKGNYELKLRPEKERDVYLETNGKSFINLTQGAIYFVEVVEDPEEANKEKTTYIAPKPEKKGKTAKDLLTDQLKGMSLEELEAKGAKYQEILEAREIEDILYN